MPAERNAFRLGLTLIVFLAVACAVLVWLAPQGGGDMELQVRYPHVQFGTPLKAGGEVLCGGKTVGAVRDLQLKEMKNNKTGYQDYYAVVTFKVDSSLGLRKDCHIEPTEALLGGMGALVIRDRGLGEQVKAGDMIEGDPAPSVADLTALLGRQLDPKNPTGLLAMLETQLDPTNARSLVGKVHKSLDDINMLTRNLAGETNVNEKAALLAKLHEVLNNVNLTTAALRDELNTKANTAAVAKVHQVLDQFNQSLVSVRGMLEENRDPVRRTIQHVEGTSRILEEQIATRLAQQLDTSNAASLLARIHASIEKLGRLLEDVNSITADVRDVVSLNKNNLDAMISNLKETSDHLKAGSKEIRLNPWLLLYTPTQDELGQSKLFGTARAFTEAATHLDDAVTRLQAISASPQAQGAAARQEIEAIRTQLKDTFAKFNEVEKKLWEQLNIK